MNTYHFCEARNKYLKNDELNHMKKVEKVTMMSFLFKNTKTIMELRFKCLATQQRKKFVYLPHWPTIRIPARSCQHALASMLLPT